MSAFASTRTTTTSSSSSPPEQETITFHFTTVSNVLYPDPTNLNLLQFNINSSHASFVNALRRIIMAEINIIGFAENDIKIHKNISCFHDEFIKDRISLLPIYHLTEHDLKTRKYIFTIDTTQQTLRPLDITTQCITGKVDGEEQLNGADLEQIFKPFEYVDLQSNEQPILKKSYPLITRLRVRDPIETLHVVMTPSIHNGNYHSAFCPVSKCCYYNQLNQDLVQEQRAQLKEAQKIRDFELHDQYRLYRKDQTHHEATDFTFILETIGTMKPHIVVNTALNVLIQKIDEMIQSQSTWETTIPEIDMKAIDIHFYNMCHTMGNLIQSYIYFHYLIDKQHHEFEYAGYLKIHPLENHVIFRLAFPETIERQFETTEHYKQAVQDKFKDCIQSLKKNVLEPFQIEFDEQFNRTQLY